MSSGRINWKSVALHQLMTVKDLSPASHLELACLIEKHYIVFEYKFQTTLHRSSQTITLTSDLRSCRSVGTHPRERSS